MSSRAKGRLTLALALLTVLVLPVSIPGSLRDAWDRGGLYLFSQEFLEDLPRRLTGPGWFRFIVQPLVAAEPASSRAGSTAGTDVRPTCARSCSAAHRAASSCAAAPATS